MCWFYHLLIHTSPKACESTLFTDRAELTDALTRPQRYDGKLHLVDE